MAKYLNVELTKEEVRFLIETLNDYGCTNVDEKIKEALRYSLEEMKRDF